MDFNERYELVDRIITGISLCQWNNEIFFVYDPRPKDRILAEHYYKGVYHKLCVNGVPPENEMIALIYDKKVWSDDLDKQLEEKRNVLSEIRKELPKLEFRSNLKNDALNKIDSIESEINELLSRKSNLLNNTAEYIANVEKFRYLLYMNTYRTDNTRLWSTINDFMNEDNSLITHLLSHSFFDKRITESTLRELARTDPWRNMWIAASKTGSLFDVPMSQITDLQRGLVTWSLIYDNAYESMECPSDDVINNDVLFDAWLENQSNKRKSDRNKQSAINSGAQEIGIPVDSVEDAKKVYELNSSRAKGILNERNRTIDKHGTVSVGNLPDQKRNIQMRLNQMAIKNG